MQETEAVEVAKESQGKNRYHQKELGEWVCACFEAIKHILDHGFKFLQVVSSFILLLTQCLRCQQWKKSLAFHQESGKRVSEEIHSSHNQAA